MKTQRRALLSVADKQGIVEFAQALVGLGFMIYASGGTASTLKASGIEVTDVATLVGGGAILGHRVVTLSRQLHAGLLARKNVESDLAELASLDIPVIDLVCVDMYPLEAQIANPESTRESVIEQTDIGGPTMIRSAAKGQRLVICDPQDRQKVIDWLKAGEPDQLFRQDLCAKGEYVISRYCLASAKYLSGGNYDGIFGQKVADCKYGENAWQTPAALFSSETSDPLAIDKFKVVEGATPSYCNWCDVDRLLQTMTHIVAAQSQEVGRVYPIAIGAKHGNACGAATRPDYVVATELMMRGDPIAIFGGMVMLNYTVTEDVAKALRSQRLDSVIAPEITTAAIDLLSRKEGKCRFIVNPALARLTGQSLDTAPRFRYVRGGFLRQPNYTFVPKLEQIQKKVRAVTGQEHSDMMMAWAIGSTSSSNTITLVNTHQQIGNAVGQQDRVGAAQLAIDRALRAKHNIAGAVAYSDSFFPFPDGPELLIKAGVKAILTSSGSIKDQATIDLCEKNDVALYLLPDAVGRGFYGH